MSSKPKSELRQALDDCRGGFYAAALFSFFINILVLTPSIYMLQVYDRVLTSRSEITLIMLTLIAVGMMAVMAILEMVRSRVLVRVGNQMDQKINSRLFRAVYERSLRVPLTSRTQPLSDLLTLRQFLTGQGLFAFFDAPWAPFFIIIGFLLHPLIGVIGLVGAILLFIMALLTDWVSRSPLEQANREAMQANLFAENNLRNAEVLEAMGMLPGIQQRWQERHGRMLALQAQASDRAGVISAITKMIRMALQSLILGAGAWLAIEQVITPGVMIAASIMMGRAFAPVEQAIGMWKGLLAARSSYDRLEDLLTRIPAPVDPMELPAPKGNLSLEAVVAVPPGSQTPTLKQVTLQVNAGEIVGVIGPSAAGKSTLARVIVGVWPAVSGKVRLDGADIMTMDRVRLGPHVGYLPQDVELFTGTVAENIARFAEIDSDKVIEAAQMAGVHDMILRLPKGYDTQLGEAGRALSAGQRQRVGLARALYGCPALVVLDEPNSNLDEEGEAALVQALIQLKARGSTALIIAHRPHVLTAVDKILVMRDGMIQMYGPRAEVMAKFVRPVQAPGKVEAVTQAKQGLVATQPG